MAGRRPLSPYTGAAHVTAPRPALTHVALYLDLLGFSLAFFLSPRVPLSVPRHVPLSRSPRLLRTVTLPSGQVRGGELCSTSLGTSLYIKCPQLLCMRDLSLLPIYLFIHSFVRSIIGVNMDSRILCILYFALVLFQHFLMYLVPQIAAAVAIGNSVLVDTWPPWTHASSLCVFLSSSFFPDTVRCSGRRLHARP